ncbi:hypothetical protein LOAG_07969, partial [Loa loa]
VKHQSKDLSKQGSREANLEMEFTAKRGRGSSSTRNWYLCLPLKGDVPEKGEDI